jgi:hypothetical protein
VSNARELSLFVSRTSSSSASWSSKSSYSQRTGCSTPDLRNAVTTTAVTAEAEIPRSYGNACVTKSADVWTAGLPYRVEIEDLGEHRPPRRGGAGSPKTRRRRRFAPPHGVYAVVR